MHKEFVIQSKINNKKLYKKHKRLYFSLNILKIGLPQCQGKHHLCVSDAIKSEGQSVGNRRGRCVVLGSCSHWESFTPFLPTTVNHTNHIRRGNGLWGNYFWNREMKLKLHMSANFQIVTCNLLTFSHLRPGAASGRPVRSQRPSGVSCEKPRWDLSPLVVCLFWY